MRDELPRERVAVGIGTLSSMLGIGGAAALVLAGLLVEHVGLSWLFWSALVVTVPAAVLTWAFVPESPVRTPARVDVVGAALLSVALVAFLLAITEGNRWGWDSARELALFAVAATVFCGWVAFERRMAAPLVDIGLMRERGVWTTNLVAAGIGAAMFGSFVLIPQLAQAPASTGYGFGDSVAASGLVLLPGALVMLFAGPRGRPDREPRRGQATPLHRLHLDRGELLVVRGPARVASGSSTSAARSWVSDSGSGSPPWPRSWSRPCRSGRPG